jgi:hypothetical protein
MACFDKKIAIFSYEITNGQKSAVFLLPDFCREKFDFGVFGVVRVQGWWFRRKRRGGRKGGEENHQ